VLVGATLAWPLAAARARADGFDVTDYVTREGSTYTLDEPRLVASLESIVTALGPAFGSTGATSGASGLALEVGWAWTPLVADTWQDDTAGALEGFHLEARKGLPAGFELAAGLGHEPTLGMTQASIALRWAWLEGDRGLPELGVRLDAGAILGHPQMTLFDFGLALVAGYPVIVAGLFELAPYGGYAFRFARSVERRIALLEGVSADPLVTSIPSQNVLLNHAVVGLRVSARPLDIGVEAALGTTVALTLQIGARL
jgi:hypothetical protein